MAALVLLEPTTRLRGEDGDRYLPLIIGGATLVSTGYHPAGPLPPGNPMSWDDVAMPTPPLIAQAAGTTTNPILPSSNEALWGAVPLLLLAVVIVAVVLVSRFFRRLRMSADAAASRAAAAEREVAGLRAELREKSA